MQTARDRLREQNRLPPGRTSSRQTDQDAVCPICIAHPTFAVETNCGHVFCGKASSFIVMNVMSIVYYVNARDFAFGQRQA